MNFQEILNFIKTTNLTVANKEMIFALALALIIGFLVSIIYRINYQGNDFQIKFARSLVLIALIAAIIIMTIKVDIILSLGLVGSLSIIRYRTSVKDSSDMVYVFWSLAAGIACGAGAYVAILAGSLILTITSLILTPIRTVRESCQLVIEATAEDQELFIKLRQQLVKKYKRCNTKLFDYSNNMQKCILELSIDPDKISEITAMIKSTSNVTNVSIYRRNIK